MRPPAVSDPAWLDTDTDDQLALMPAEECPTVLHDCPAMPTSPPAFASLAEVGTDSSPVAPQLETHAPCSSAPTRGPTYLAPVTVASTSRRFRTTARPPRTR